MTLDHKNKGKSNLRVLMVYSALPPYRLSLFNALAERFRFRVVFTQEHVPEQKFNQENLRKRLKADYGFLLRGFEIMGRIFRFGVGGEIDRFKPDVVVTFEYCPASVAVWAKRLITRAQFKHVIMTDDNPEWVKRDVLLRKLFRRILIPRLDGLILLSREVADMYRMRFNAKLPTAAVPILQKEDDFREELQNSSREARELAIKWALNGRRILLYVGRLVDVKNLDCLLRAFALIHRDLPDATLVLVGDGPERERLQRLGESLGIGKKTIFAGRCEGPFLYAWYRLGGVFALPSRWEPFAAVVNEALISGIPVVCSRYAGAHVLVKNGVNGEVVDPENLPTLSDACRKWLEKAKPLKKERLLGLKPSLMRIRFRESVDRFEELLKATWKD